MNSNNGKVIDFVGEKLWLGNLGHLFVVLMFITAVFSAVFYFRSERNKAESEKKFARSLFFIHTLSVISVFVILFLIIFEHRFEYFYAWRHSSLSLPVYYMISCFWEGQEGSFLLWLFWNAVIGVILIFTSKKWESSVLFVVAFAQIALSSMLLGVHFGSFKLGSSPFDLLREQRPELLQIPILGQLGIGNYLSVFKDGNGLNALLQNYWMVIHPPTLFLGFALAIVPFAFSIAGLWRNEDNSWLHPALIWGLVCVGILGTGIIMGGFWAYESLSFGGYWAWDPVENASLLPWLIMAASVHLLLIAKNTGRHFFSAHFGVQLSFWLVLYATFLTRSGILGEASVHSFTDLGLSGQLLLFLFGFIGLSLTFSFTDKINQNKVIVSIVTLFSVVIFSSFIIPKDWESAFSTGSKIIGMIAFAFALVLFIWKLKQRTAINLPDETIYSREFWLYMGAMFIVLSLVQVFFATSIPVFNKLFGFKTAVLKSADYNKIQLWMAMPIMIVMAVGQYFQYKSTDLKIWKNQVAISLGIAIITTIVLNFNFQISEFKYMLFLFFGIWVFVANVFVIKKFKEFKVIQWGASISHIGFGILLVGVLISSVNQKILTSNSTGIDLAPEVNSKGQKDIKGFEFNRENLIMYQNQWINIGDYKALYSQSKRGTGADSIDKYFSIKFIDPKTKDSFIVKPKTQNNSKMGLLAEPSTKHYISKDIFTHVNYESGMDKVEPFSNFSVSKVKVQQAFTTNSGKCQIRIVKVERYKDNDGLVIRLTAKANRLTDSSTLYPEFKISESKGTFEALPVKNESLGLMLLIQNIKILDPNPEKQLLEFDIQTGEKTPVKNYIVLKVIEFPWINLVWSGTIIMLLGFIIAVVNRVKIQLNLFA